MLCVVLGLQLAVGKDYPIAAKAAFEAEGIGIAVTHFDKSKTTGIILSRIAVVSQEAIQSTVTNKFGYLRGRQFLALPRRERRAYRLPVCEERATMAAAKRAATRRAAPELPSGCAAPQSQSAGGYAPSSRLAIDQLWRSAGVEIYFSQY